MVIVVDAVKPYAGTSGWSGTSTSRDRAVDADRKGDTKKRQLATLNALIDSGIAGLTWRELAAIYGWHHGTASGVLSVLHKAGLISRLSDSRNRCKIYVCNEYVLERATENHGRKNSAVQAVQDVLCGCYCCASILNRLENM